MAATGGFTGGTVITLWRWEFIDVLLGLATGSGLIWIFALVFHPGQDVVEWFVRWNITAIIAIGVTRGIAHMIVNRLRLRGVLTHRVAILGAGEEGLAAVEHLTNERLKNGAFEIVGIFDERGGALR